MFWVRRCCLAGFALNLLVVSCVPLTVEHLVATASAGGSDFGSSVGFARLLKELAATHLSLEPTSLNDLAESSHRFLNRFSFPND